MHKFTPEDGLHGVINWDDPAAPFVTSVEHVYENTVTTLRVPVGFRSDFASVPRFFWRVFPRLGQYARAALFHDYAYTVAIVPRVRADAIFLAMMKEDGVGLWPRLPMYLAVRSFGWVSWLRRHGSLQQRSRVESMGRGARLLLRIVAVLLLAILLLSLMGGTAPGQCYVLPNGQRVCPQPQRNTPAAFYGGGEVQVDPALAAATVRIAVDSARGRSLGSGALVAADAGAGYVLTCAHLFDDGVAAIAVMFPGGERHQAAIVEADRPNDVALLRIAATSVRPIPIGGEVQQAAVLTCCGYGGQGQFRAVRGPAAGGATAHGATAPSVQIRGGVRSGDSGGPVLNAAGRLVGVIWGVRQGITYAMHGRPVRRLLARVLGSRPPPAASQPAARPPATTPVTLPHQGSARRLDDLDGRLATVERGIGDMGSQVQELIRASQASRQQTEQAVAALEEDQEDRRGLLGRVADVAKNKASEVAGGIKDRALERVGERLDGIDFSAQGWQLGITLAGALGLGGPMSLVAAWAVRRMGRRLERRIDQRLERRGQGVRDEGRFWEEQD